MSENMKDMIEFPVMYTFKAMGENNDTFKSGVKDAFSNKKVESHSETPSKKGNYVSVSVTTVVEDYNELQSIYSLIKKINGLKYHL